MTRITSYNILAGGYDIHSRGYTQRTQPLISIIRSTQPDVVGLIEATNTSVTKRPLVVEQVAEALDMQLVMANDSPSPHAVQYQPALLTRLPIVYKKVHIASTAFVRPLLEVCVEEANGQHLVIFVTHLSAAFNHGWAGSSIRGRELREILRIMAQVKDKPHLLMGDFNSLAPGDAFKASYLLRYITQMDEQRRQLHISDGHPHLDGIVPDQLHFLNPLLRLIARSSILRYAFDGAASLYAPRGTIAMIQRAGYVDCYRHVHPHAHGFTCPSAAPAGRIDFIFANPRLAQRLATCSTVLNSEDVPGRIASDHLPVSAEFREMAGEMEEPGKLGKLGELQREFQAEIAREGVA